MNYKWDAEEYSKNSGNQKRWADGLLKQIDFKGNEIVLDIGCGDGKITSLLRGKTPRGTVLGIDSSKDMIGLAKGRYDGKYKNLSFKKADACRLGFKNRFDIVFSNAALQWIPDHDALIPRLFSLVRRGGALAVQVVGVTVVLIAIWSARGFGPVRATRSSKTGAFSPTR